MTRYARFLSAALILSVLGACASGPEKTWPPEQPLASIAPTTEIDDTPFYPQEKYHCGPAALATVLDYRAVSVKPEDLVDEVYLPKREGSLQLEIVAAARKRGLLVYRIDPSLEALLRELDAGNPVLVMQNLGLDWIVQWHYAVAIGYTLDPGEMVLRSGTIRRRTTSMAVFDRTWERSDRWALVITQPDDIPRTATHNRLMSAAYDLERVGNLEAARLAFDAATLRWPDSGTAYMAAGNAAYNLNDYVGARRAFFKAIEQREDWPEAWNNLSMALLESGCADAARTSISCALRVKPRDGTLMATAYEIDQLADSIARSGVSCSVPRCPVDE